MTNHDTTIQTISDHTDLFTHADRLDILCKYDWLFCMFQTSQSKQVMLITMSCIEEFVAKHRSLAKVKQLGVCGNILKWSDLQRMFD